ncbi:MFS transporter [Paenibacillus sacheonensis]|uniref:MFS transporter n=1 Tax=Paenibacillus sacheonensis TaxID=742054 RepID=A0A7X4YTJ3_9BACL|nr:MFS transporter [Paenibacillus sacheonensis]MBM7568478.1 putative MFS family arabinose efflux permease [Paenibacillus sacheonensis]NBC72307.1 MFS transporter [Paenibacillus sacheonensis]
MSRYTALLFAAACGLAVANIYYAQPLLDALSSEFGIAPSSVGIVITVTQICYASGLLLLVPLGDLLNRRRLIPGLMLLSVLALVAVGTAPTGTVLLIGLAAVGLLAVVTQVLVAFAAALAAPVERGRTIGLVISGVVIGILLARTFAGVWTDLAGWRSVYLVSAALTLVMAGVLFRVLPHEERERPPLSYLQLLRSVCGLFVQERILRVRAVLALLIFAAFSILWTSLVLPLSSPPLSLSHTAIGAFGLAGAAGALAASRAGRLADRGQGQRTTGVSLTLLLASWLPIGYTEHSLLALIVGILLLDLAVQAVHVTNQSMIYNVRPEARSRLTAGYMVFYSIGSAAGSIASTRVYAYAGWNGVCWLGAAVSASALSFWALTRRSRAVWPTSLGDDS